jgi:transposase-like protein
VISTSFRKASVGKLRVTPEIIAAIFRGISIPNWFLRGSAKNNSFAGDTELRQSKYLNNIIEQDHRAIKRIVKPMMDLRHSIPQEER